MIIFFNEDPAYGINLRSVKKEIVAEIEDWIINNLQEGSYYISWHSIIYLSKEDDLLMFKLRWL